MLTAPNHAYRHPRASSTWYRTRARLRLNKFRCRCSGTIAKRSTSPQTVRLSSNRAPRLFSKEHCCRILEAHTTRLQPELAIAADGSCAGGKMTGASAAVANHKIKIADKISYLILVSLALLWIDISQQAHASIDSVPAQNGQLCKLARTTIFAIILNAENRKGWKIVATYSCGCYMPSSQFISSWSTLTTPMIRRVSSVHCYTCIVKVLKCSLISIYGESKLNRGDFSNDHPAADHKFFLLLGVTSGRVRSVSAVKTSL